MNIPRLSRPQRRRLIQVGRKSGDPATALRFLIVAKLCSGLSRNRVAGDLSTAVSSVVRTAQRFTRGGVEALYDRRRYNGQRKVCGLYRAHLEIVLRRTPQEFGWPRPTWTRELLGLEMRRVGLPSVTACTVGRALRQIRARLKRPKAVVLCPWLPEMRDARLAVLRRIAARATQREPVFYVDEVDIHLNPKIGFDWMLPGRQRHVVTPGKNQKRYIAGALNASSGRLVYVAAKRKNSKLFCALLKRLVRTQRNAKTIHLILDNYAIHKSRITQRLVAELGDKIALHFLPPYCPDANRIERLWLDLHANVTRNHRCASIDELMRRVFNFLHARNRRRSAAGTRQTIQDRDR